MNLFYLTVLDHNLILYKQWSTECDAYESANTNSMNHQTHDEEDIPMTECSAYGANQRPQSEYYDDIVNNKPSDQELQTKAEYDYI